MEGIALGSEKSLEIKRDNEWSVNLCNCFQYPLLWCYALLCPCLFQSRVQKACSVERERLNAIISEANQENGDDSKASDGIQSEPYEESIFAKCFKFITCIHSGSTRSEIRRDYAIPGSFVGDVFCHCCCWPCALVQEGIQLAKGQDFRNCKYEKQINRRSNENLALEAPPVLDA